MITLIDDAQVGDLSEQSWLLFSTIRISSASTVPGWWQVQAGLEVKYLDWTGLFVLQCCFPPWVQTIKWWPLKRDWLRNSAQVVIYFTRDCRAAEQIPFRQGDLTVIISFECWLYRRDGRYLCDDQQEAGLECWGSKLRSQLPRSGDQGRYPSLTRDII